VGRVLGSTGLGTILKPTTIFLPWGVGTALLLLDAKVPERWWAPNTSVLLSGDGRRLAAPGPPLGGCPCNDIYEEVIEGGGRGLCVGTPVKLYINYFGVGYGMNKWVCLQLRKGEEKQTVTDTNGIDGEAKVVIDPHC
jgi:hypothetical protein